MKGGRRLRFSAEMPNVLGQFDSSYRHYREALRVVVVGEKVDLRAALTNPFMHDGVLQFFFGFDGRRPK
jgi:hypothetical protein